MINKPDIVDYIKQFMPLQKHGKSWWACCPFHSEKQPSFTVNRDKQLWFCFGCQKGGDVLAFIQQYHNVDFSGSLDIIGHKRPESKRDRRRLAREIQIRKKEQKRIQAEFEEQQEQNRKDFIRLAELDGLISLTVEVMTDCRDMADIEDISTAIHKLPVWEYERDGLLYA